MAWKAGRIQQIDTGINGFSGPGFVIQQDGRSPSLTIVFHNEKEAEVGREAFQSILDKAAVIVGN